LTWLTDQKISAQTSTAQVLLWLQPYFVNTLVNLLLLLVAAAAVAVVAVS